ncbi:hypothetical protein ACFLV7_11255 [Chloroflexota bacterium]
MYKKIKEKFFLKEKREVQENPNKYIRDYPRPPCGGAYWAARSRELWVNHSGKNEAKPTSRKSKSLYYKGSKIIELHRLSFGLGYEITLETNETMRISDEEWLENVTAGS